MPAAEKGSPARPRPAVVVVGHAHLDTLAREFRRYEQDYRVECFDNGVAAVEFVQNLDGAPLALCIAEYELSDGVGLDVLEAVHRLVPTAKRIGAVFGFLSATAAAYLEAAQTGRIDVALAIPRGVRDEEFHTAVTEQLSEWAWTSATPEVFVYELVTHEPSRELGRLLDFASRMGVPAAVYRPDSEDGRRVIAQAEEAGFEWEWPLVRLSTGAFLSNPSLEELAAFSNPPVEETAARVIDFAVIGAGPAGLAAAVYGASEGLDTVVFEAEAIGGQAGTSSMIRNYLGFPRGISGMRLTQRARTQASRFGASFFSVSPVSSLRKDDDDGLFRLTVRGTEFRARSVLISAGVTYRRLGVPALEEFEGAGVYYGAAAATARKMQGRHVFVVGGGNSAGQAAIHLSRFAKAVTIVIRRDSLESTMSDYLIREINANYRISVKANSEVVGGGGENGRLEWITLRSRVGSYATNHDIPAAGLYLLLGAESESSWYPEELGTDEHGFVCTGSDVEQRLWIDGRPPQAFETSIPGLFAAGDIRANSMKRVASAAGEGATIVPLVHRYLAEREG
ncbi:FAD-dependent oxidoreductase [Arthrobacter sp. UM1]|nr:FAD-dependent oxidoreductase [Arthrobacter sp. UM1]